MKWNKEESLVRDQTKSTRNESRLGLIRRVTQKELESKQGPTMDTISTLIQVGKYMHQALLFIVHMDVQGRAKWWENWNSK